MKNLVALVLGGGRGTRLYPLTKYRSKPAVPIGGKYRLIDIPISNCINSGVNQIYVLTQFNSVSLHRHISSTYAFDHFGGGYVEILAAQQTNERMDWYQGTADAVRKNLVHVQQSSSDAVLILSGDQLYRMDFRAMLKTHRESGADVTIAAVPVYSRDAGGLGIMRLDETGRVVGFLEKPKTKEELALVRTNPAWIDARGIASRGRDCMASMGIYLFNTKTLVDVLEKTDYQDFGKEVFPASIRSRRVQVHLFDGYWEDIGTIKSFFEANLGLADLDPAFKLWLPHAPIFSRPRSLPPTKFHNAQVTHSLIADGSSIEEGAVIENCMLGLRCRIGRNVVIRNSIIMGNDNFDALPAHGELPFDIGEGSHIENAIIDKNCRIGSHVTIVNDRGVENTDETEHFMIRDGIVVVSKGSTLPDGWCLQKNLQG